MAARREANDPRWHLRKPGRASRLQSAAGGQQILLHLGQAVGLYAESILAGEAQGAFGKEPSPAEAEEGLRSMAT